MKKFYINEADQDVIALGKQDPRMKRLIQLVGNLEIDMRTDFLKSLIRSIVGQLISVQAAEAVFNRLSTLINHQFTSSNLLHLTDEQFREVGLSKRKGNYIHDLADKVDNATIDLQKLIDLDNQTVLQQLTSIKGIGKWTAEMFLIFSLGRKDVLALDDIGTQRAAAWLYNGDKTNRRQILREKAVLWNPHYTIATFYLWEAVLLGYVMDYPSLEELERNY